MQKLKRGLLIIVFIFVNTGDLFLKNTTQDSVSGIDFGYLPPRNKTLLRQEQKRKENEQLKNIERAVHRVMRKSKPKRRRRRAKGRLKQKQKKVTKKKIEKAHLPEITPELMRLLEEQYEDPTLVRKLVSLQLKKVGIREAIAVISKIANVTLIVDADVQGQVLDFSFKDISLAALLKILLGNNVPRLSLVRHLGVWRIVRIPVAIELLHTTARGLIERDTKSSSITLYHTKWDKQFKARITSLWQGIVGADAQKRGYYLVFDDITKKLFFRGRSSHVADFTACLKEIDIQMPQVRIEARVVLADKDFEEAFGFEWSGIYDRSASSHPSITERGYGYAGLGVGDKHMREEKMYEKLLGWSLNFIPSQIKNAATIKLPFVFGNKDFSTRRLNLMLNAAESKNEIKTILKPTLLVNNEEPAEILVGQEFPQEVRLQETIEGQLTNVTSVNYKDIGMKIKVKPQVTPDQQAVFLDIFVESSSVVTSPLVKIALQNQIAQQSHFNYTVKLSRSRNRVILKSGQTTLIGGLISDHKERGRTGIPWLQEIPGLGWLFQGRRKVTRDEQLLIFLTPTLV